MKTVDNNSLCSRDINHLDLTNTYRSDLQINERLFSPGIIRILESYSAWDLDEFDSPWRGGIKFSKMS